MDGMLFRIASTEGTRLRKAYRVIWVTAAIACLYLGWTYYSRWKAGRALVERLVQPKAAKDRAIADAYGGGRLKLLDFYAVPGEIRRGAKAQLCYGIANATAVRIEPPVENVWLSFGRCVDVSPKSDTVYKLIARDAAGNEKTFTTAIRVR